MDKVEHAHTAPASPSAGGEGEAAGRSAVADWPEREALLYTLYDRAPRGVLLTRPNGTIAGCNAALATLLGYAKEELIGRHFNSFTHPEDGHLGVDAVRDVILGKSERVVVDKRYVRKDGSAVWVNVDGIPIRDAAGKVILFVSSIEDLTPARKRDEERRLAEEQRTKLQAQIIAAQHAALQKLSTPIIPIRDGVLAVPLIGSIDRERAELLLSTMLDGVSSLRARQAIIDVTGVETIDEEVARLFVRMAGAVRLLGAEVLLCGIRAEVAQRLVAVGIDLGGIRTVASFQSAIAQVFAADEADHGSISL